MTACQKAPYRGPVTDHFDGTHFRAPEPIANKSFFSVLKWRLTSKRTTWSNWVDYDVGVTPLAHFDGIKATFINHSTFLLQVAGQNLLTDPIWAERASPFSFWGPKRVHAPGVDFDALPRIDTVLISHSHYDHLDMATVQKLVARDNPLFVVPLGVDALIKAKAPTARTQALDWGQQAQTGGLTVTAQPTQHWSARWLNDRNETLWASFVIESPSGRIYFAGDTGYGSGHIFRDLGVRYGGFDLALLPIGAYAPRWFMAPAHINPAEAVQIAKDIHAKQAIAMHFGTFQLTDEGMDQPVTDLRDALARPENANVMFQVLQPGQAWQN